MANDEIERKSEVGKGDNASSELKAARLRFESMTTFSKEAWLERARKILPPSLHNDPDAVLFTALELLLNEKAIATRDKSCVKRGLFVLVLFLLFSAPFSASAFWPFTKKETKTAPKQDDRPLAIYQATCQNDYSGLVQEASANGYVISADSQPATSLHRALKEIPIAMNLGSHPERLMRRGSDPGQGGAELQKKNEEPAPLPVCQDVTVYFDKNSAVLNGKEMKRLIEHINELRQKGVVVSGYTCNLGSQAFNDYLAWERVATVVAFLKKNGVKTVDVAAKGKCCYVSKDRAKNRRVEITCTRMDVHSGPPRF